MGQKVIKGLVSDNDPINQIEGTYPFAKNGIQNFIKGSATNEPGFLQSACTIPYKYNGIIETDTRPIIFSTDNVNSSIGFYDPAKDEYQVILNDTIAGFKLGFKTDWYITGQYQKNNKDEYEIAFTDKNSAFKFLNCTKPDVSKPDDLLFFLKATTPTMVVKTEAGGELLNGSYVVALKYTKLDGAETPYLISSSPRSVVGTGADGVSGKSLRIDLTNVDLSYDFAVFAVIRKVKGQVTVTELNPVSINSQMTFVYSGNEIGLPITLEEVLIKPKVYKTVGTVGQLNDSLYMGKLVEDDPINYQKYANLIKVTWESKLVNLLNKPEEVLSGEEKGMGHEEIYALFVRLKLTSGGVTDAFHIPGLAPNISETESFTSGGVSGLKFQITDTIRTVVGNTGTCGVWENQSELYPNDENYNSLALGGENLKGQKVRHHKMPSMHFMKNVVYSGIPDYGRSVLDILGLKLSNVIIPAELVGKVTGYELLYAKRTTANITCFGQSLLLYAGQDLKLINSNTQSNFSSTGGNFHSYKELNALRTFDDPRDEVLQIKRDRVRLHPFELLFNKPSLPQNAYLSLHFKHRVENPVENILSFGCNLDIPKADRKASDVIGVVYKLDYMTGNAPFVVSHAQRYKKLNKLQYATNNINTGEYNNASLETAIVGQLSEPGPAVSTSFHAIPEGDKRLKELDTRRYVKHEETYLVTLKALKIDVYQSFLSQTLIATGKFFKLDEVPSAVFAGDTFPCEYTYHTYGLTSPVNDVPSGANPELIGTRVIRRFVCESFANINQRYEEVGNKYSLWWPKTEVGYLTAYIKNFNRSIDPNQFGYSKDLNALNEFESVRVFNPAQNFNSSFPYRVHRGGKAKKEGVSKNWRTLLPLDYYDMPKNMGPVVNLVGMDDKLLIHMQNSLFVTQDKTKLESDVLSITLGSGDIFQFEPQESLGTKLGFAGTKHDLACVLTPIGYIFPDSSMGKLFIYKDGLKNFGVGVENFLGDYLTIDDVNPFIGNGITIGYDPQYDRVLLTVKNKALPATIQVVPGFKETQQFFNTLISGQSIVYKDGRFQKFLGVNATAFNCPVLAIITLVSTNGTVFENAIALTYAAKIVASGITGGKYTYFIISGNVNNAFKILPSGDIVVNDVNLLNFVTHPVYTLGVKAVDISGISAQANVTINVIAVAKPIAIKDYELSLSELSPNGTIVVQIAATGGMAALTYSIVSGNFDNGFSINAISGVITLLNNQEIDYELTPKVVLGIAATDGTTSATGKVTIHILNINEPPVAADVTFTIEQTHNFAVPIGFANIAIDPEVAAEKQTLTYTLQSQTTPGILTIDLNPASLTFLQVKLVSGTVLNSTLFYELTIRATDSGEPAAFLDYKVRINVTPVILCGTSAAYSGGLTFPSLHIVQLGTAIGEVRFFFNPNSIPDKFIVEFDGVVVINTGYRGDSVHQSNLNAALTNLGLPLETITSTALGVLSFKKTTATSTATVKVFAPLTGTDWNFGLGCPFTPVGNTVQSIEKQRDNCGVGFVGQTVTYTVPANTYFGMNLTEANDLALNDIITNSQTYANTNGTCAIAVKWVGKEADAYCEQTATS